MLTTSRLRSRSALSSNLTHFLLIRSTSTFPNALLRSRHAVSVLPKRRNTVAFCQIGSEHLSISCGWFLQRLFVTPIAMGLAIKNPLWVADSDNRDLGNRYFPLPRLRLISSNPKISSPPQTASSYSAPA
ncbi:hypothetical protein L596_008350 [Steinernema carpocapsae]|uniref:Uncharacterized protein n=1 Tax=Steinernema carpocapsae TaxID=34508 RepID=A0A4V6A698_STECR|nr:hypothetical protein L596_008350 [Steinernema carpocapsae]